MTKVFKKSGITKMGVEHIAYFNLSKVALAYGDQLNAFLLSKAINGITILPIFDKLLIISC